jgi:hypothetical protein
LTPSLWSRGRWEWFRKDGLPESNLAGRPPRWASHSLVLRRERLFPVNLALHAFASTPHASGKTTIQKVIDGSLSSHIPNHSARSPDPKFGGHDDRLDAGCWSDTLL